jgi:hypothetical protein
VRYAGEIAEKARHLGKFGNSTEFPSAFLFEVAGTIIALRVADVGVVSARAPIARS